MKTTIIVVRIAVLLTAGMFAAEMYTAERIGVRSGATFQNGAFYAPGRYPGDGRSK